VTIPKSPV